MSFFSSLKREQKEAIGLLQIGTLLEYFDLMLYVHMAVLLNELFFPKTEPHTAALLTALTFCSTFVLRPFGALIFGHIGDTFGRKPTVVITTTMMAMSCVLMANLPTYAEIGISAAWIVILCRILQGFSSMGEIAGAQIYVTEITKPPFQYPVVSFLNVMPDIGGMLALGVASLVITMGLNWRIAFWVGAVIAIVGSVARTRLRETPQFLDMKRKNTRKTKEEREDNLKKSEKLSRFGKFIKNQTINKKTLLAYFFIKCGWPICFYLAFIYMNPTLKAVYGYTSEDIIFHNFFLSVVGLFASILWAMLSFKIYPLKLLALKAITFGGLSVLLPMLILKAPNPYFIFVLQSLILIFPLDSMPAMAIFVKNFHISKRFTMIVFGFALAHALMYVSTSFGLVYLTEFFGHYGLWVIILPVTGAFLWGVHHFKNLERASGSFPIPLGMTGVIGP